MDWKLILVGLVPSICIGQEATSKRIVLPSGSAGYSIRCDNMNMNFCYEKAGEICFLGYDIQTENREQGQESSEGGYLGPGVVAGTTLGLSSSTSRTTSEKGLLILCREPEATEKERAIRFAASEKIRVEQVKKMKEEEHEISKLLAVFLGGVIVIAAVMLIAGTQ